MTNNNQHNKEEGEGSRAKRKNLLEMLESKTEENFKLKTEEMELEQQKLEFEERKFDMQMEKAVLQFRGN